MKKRDVLQCKSMQAKLIDGRMLKRDNLFKGFVVSVSKALKISSLLSSCSVATFDRTEEG
jgi:hypothetical protein